MLSLVQLQDDQDGRAAADLLRGQLSGRRGPDGKEVPRRLLLRRLTGASRLRQGQPIRQSIIKRIKTGLLGLLELVGTLDQQRI